jgi:hypothetical protein
MHGAQPSRAELCSAIGWQISQQLCFPIVLLTDVSTEGILTAVGKEYIHIAEPK